MAIPPTISPLPPMGRPRPAPAGIVPPQRPAASPLERFGFWALGLFLFLMFGRPADFLFPYLHLPLISSATAMLIAVLIGGLTRVMRSPLGLLMTGLTCWFILTIPFSSYRGGSFQTISSLWMRSYLCFVLIVAVCDRPLQVRRLIQLLALSLFIASLLALRYGVAPFGRLQLPTGLLTGPNELAGAMIVGILYWLFVFFDPYCSMIYRVFSVVALLPMMVVLLKTGSRGGLLSLMIVLTVMFFRLPAAKKMVVAGGAFVLFILAVITLPEDLRKRFTTYFSDDDTQQSEESVDNPTGSTDSRLYLLRRSVEFTISHPLFGVGPDQFATYEDKVARAAGGRRGAWLGCHNTYTQISSETGLPGLLIFLSLLVMAWRSTITLQRQTRRIQTPYAITVANTAVTLRMVLIAYMIFFFFEHTAYMPFWPTLLGLIAALRNGFEVDLPLMEGKKTQPSTPALRRNLPGRLPLPARA